MLNINDHRDCGHKPLTTLKTLQNATRLNNNHGHIIG